MTKSPKYALSKIGSKNPMWKGDKVGYDALHDWVKRNVKKTSLCQECNLVPSMDAANISNEYKRDASDWEWLCRKCHMVKDGRWIKLNRFTKGNKLCVGRRMSEENKQKLSKLFTGRTPWNKGLKTSRKDNA